MYSPARQKGNIAEEIIVKHIEKHGFTILERNYLRKWGEIDIIAKNNDIVHFIEVKSSYIVSHETPVSRETEWKIIVSDENNGVSHETDIFNPVWNMTKYKKSRFSRAIKTYITETFSHETPDIQIDLYSVVLDEIKNTCYITIVDNVLLE